MARPMHDDTPELFRAVVVTTGTRTDGSTWERTRFHGPYSTRQAANALLTREKRAYAEAKSRGREALTEVRTYVERTSATWERVDG